MSESRFGQVIRLQAVDSTNRYLAQRAAEGAPDGTVVVADYQSAGRGRFERRWEAPPGSSLLCSVLCRLALGPEDLHLPSVAVALAGRAACAGCAGVEVAVKWPNDLVVGARKLAGVLAEAGGVGPGGVVPVVVGIGVNLTWPGPPEAGGTSLLQAPGRQVSAEELLEALLDELGPRRAALETPPGRQGLAEELVAHCATLGQAVRVDLGTRVLHGVAVGLTERGHLVIEDAAGRHEVAAGDVVHLRSTGRAQSTL